MHLCGRKFSFSEMRDHIGTICLNSLELGDGLVDKNLVTQPWGLEFRSPESHEVEMEGDVQCQL